MQLSPLYLAEIQAAEERGEQAVIMRQLKRRVGDLSVQFQERIKSLPVEKLENLGEALLEFTSMEDLTTWLNLECTSYRVMETIELLRSSQLQE